MEVNWTLTRKRDALHVRAAMIRAMRKFFMDRDYLEVETPSRIPGIAPECHIDAIPSDGWYLHTSPELCMKRLLASGYPRIFHDYQMLSQRRAGITTYPGIYTT